MEKSKHTEKENKSKETTDIDSGKPYFSLSPRDDLDKKNETKENYKHYEQKLKWALDNAGTENIKNIAITGYYGAGKSSILKTFIKNHHSDNTENGKFKFLELSLATFHDDKQGSEKVKDIEKSLLQQIFYKVDDVKIPNSRLKKISNRISLNIIGQGLLTVIIMCILVRLYNLIFNIRPFFGFYWLDIALVVATFYMILLKMDVLSRLSPKRLKYKSLEVEIEKNTSELSILSRFLDEIIYFFKQTKYNVVLIEDIDRFESTEVFSNLRELNLILNSTDLINQNIVFIYAIKNEQFKTASDRTKFFDFIIPVIPVVNFETAANHFLNNLEESDIDIQHIDRYMVNSLFYLNDDLRIINNIFNELKTYHKILEKGGFYNDGDDKEIEVKVSLINRLIPLLFYKNVEPYDFSCMLKKKGYLYKIIDIEEQIKEKHITTLRNEINGINKTIKEANNKAISDINEVKILVINILLNLASKKLNLSNKNIAFNKISSDNDLDKIFDILIQDKNIIAKNINNSSYQATISLTDVEKELIFKIDDRIKHISNKNLIHHFKEKINNIEESIFKINNQSLAQTIKSEDIDHILNLETQKKLYKERNKNSKKDIIEPNKQLIEILILNDYINKDYFLYLSDYTKLGISLKDYKFLLSIKIKKNIGFEKPIDKPETILERISPSDFNSNAILNFALVDYIVKNTVANYPERIYYIVDWLSNFGETANKFIIRYYQEAENKNRFIHILSLRSKNLWLRIMDDNLFEKHRDNLYKLIIDNAPKERLVDYCNNSDFSAYIEVDTLNIFNIERYKLKFLIDSLKDPIKLKKINTDGSIPNLHYIFNSNFYEINLYNIDSFINVYGVKVKNYKSKLLTVINQQETLAEMRNYIYSTENFEDFIKNIILENPKNTKEEEPIILEILNMLEEKVSLETKKSLFKLQEFTVKNITEVENSSLRLFILKTQRMGNHVDNVLSFYETISKLKTADERNKAIADVINYIINLDSVLNVYDKTQRENLQQLIDLCISSNELDNKIYEKFISLLSKRLTRKDFNFTPAKNLEKDKFKILIANKYLALTQENISFIEDENYEDLLPLFFEKYENKLIEFFSINQKPYENIASAVLKANIDDAIKTELINLFNDNKVELFDFSNFKQLVLNHLFKTEGRNFDEGVKLLFIDGTFKLEFIPKIFNIISDVLNKEQIKTFFESQESLPYHKLSKSKKRPSFEINDANEKMLNTLKEKEIISDYHKDLENNKFNVKYVNKY
jgi:hypothetical protein